MQCNASSGHADTRGDRPASDEAVAVQRRPWARGRAGAAALQPLATNAQSAAAPAQTPSPTPTRVLNAPLSAVLAVPSVTSTPTAATTNPSTPTSPTPASQSSATNAQAAPAQAPSPALSGRFRDPTCQRPATSSQLTLTALVRNAWLPVSIRLGHVMARRLPSPVGMRPKASTL